MPEPNGMPFLVHHHVSKIPAVVTDRDLGLVAVMTHVTPTAEKMFKYINHFKLKTLLKFLKVWGSARIRAVQVAYGWTDGRKIT